MGVKNFYSRERILYVYDDGVILESGCGDDDNDDRRLQSQYLSIRKRSRILLVMYNSYARSQQY